MLIYLESNVVLSDVGCLDSGIHDVPENLAAALITQRLARLVTSIEAAPERQALEARQHRAPQRVVRQRKVMPS